MKLLLTAGEDIPFLLQTYADEARAMERNAVEICWYMRGGISWEQVWFSMSPKQRIAASKLVEDNIERTKTSGMPLL